MDHNFDDLKNIYTDENSKVINNDIEDIMNCDIPDNIKRVMVDMLVSVKHNRDHKFN